MLLRRSNQILSKIRFRRGAASLFAANKVFQPGGGGLFPAFLFEEDPNKDMWLIIEGHEVRPLCVMLSFSPDSVGMDKIVALLGPRWRVEKVSASLLQPRGQRRSSILHG